METINEGILPVTSPRTARRHFITAIIFLLPGLAFRIWVYLNSQPLWTAEILLALNVTNRSFGELLQPLDYNQSAAPGFLWLAKGITQLVVNPNNYRLLPLAAGLLALAIFPLVARYYLPWRAVIIGIILLSFSLPVVMFTVQFKQYSLDLLCVLLALLLFPAIRNSSLKALDIFLFSIAGAALLWVSQPAVFVLTAVSMGLLFTEIWQKSGSRITRILIILFIWALSFLPIILLALPALENQTLAAFWQSGYPPDNASIGSYLSWIVRNALKMFDGLAVNSSRTLITAALFLLGIIAVARMSIAKIIVLLLPIGLVIAAALTKSYPLSGRLLLFLAPLLIILVAQGIDFLLAWPKNRFIIAALTLGLLLFLGQSVYKSFAFFTNTVERPEVYPSFQYAHHNWRENDIIFEIEAASGDETIFLSWARLPAKNVPIRLYVDSSQNWPDRYHIIDTLAGRYNRLWIIFTNPQSAVDPADKERIISYLSTKGTFQPIDIASGDSNMRLLEIRP